MQIDQSPSVARLELGDRISHPLARTLGVLQSTVSTKPYSVIAKM